MFEKKDTIIGRKSELSNYVEGYDIYNSAILEKLKFADRVLYEITNNEYRPDLIAQDIYGDTSYEAFLLISCATPLTGFSKGTILRIIPKETLNRIINEI